MTHHRQTQLPNAEVITNRYHWLMVWLVPVLALLIAGYIGYDAWRTQGYEVELLFDNASGLEAGKTTVKYKDVTVGKVKQIRLSDDMQWASVLVSMDRQFARNLYQDTRFWVVRPRVTTRTISGLGTLLSGAYIALQPGHEEGSHLAYSMRGLDEPPTFSGFADGQHFRLTAERLGSMDIGSPVFYRGLAVGEVVSYTLDQKNQMDIQVFVKSPYHRLVTANTYFWQVNGLEFSMGADGVKAQMESLLSFMQGGVSFENFDQLAVGDHLSQGDDDHFQLYPNQSSILTQAGQGEPNDVVAMMHSLKQILAQLEQAQIGNTLQALQKTTEGINRVLDANQDQSVLRQTEALLAQTNQLMKQFDTVPKEMNATLVQTRMTLATLDTSLQGITHSLNADSVLQNDLRHLLQEVARASTAIETLADTLQRQPNAVIFGKN